jgi:hypothetical protein
MRNFLNGIDELGLKNYLRRNVSVWDFRIIPLSIDQTPRIACAINSVFNGPTLPFCHPFASKPINQKLLLAGESIVTSEKGFDSGSIGRNGGTVKDVFDLYLLKNKSNDYTLVPYMRIQFLFEESEEFVWKDLEKIRFVDTFKKQIDRAWGNRKLIKKLKSGKKVYIEHRFDTWIAGTTSNEHWEVYVKKIKPKAFSTSYVVPTKKEVHLDSEDINPVYKGNNQYQRGVIHEFGHMIGLPDEYHTTSKFSQDYPSVMNRGESVLDRHRDAYMDWLDKALKRMKIN